MLKRLLSPTIKTIAKRNYNSAISHSNIIDLFILKQERIFLKIKEDYSKLFRSATFFLNELFHNKAISFGDNSRSSEVNQDAIWLSSTMKKRRMKMNKHKLKKRRKLLRMNTKQSRT